MASTPGPATRQVGRRIRSVRQRAGLTLEELAERSGMTPARVSRVERGEQSPTVRTLERFADALKVDLLTFFWSDRSIDEIGLQQIPGRVRELVTELIACSDDDLLRAKIVLFALLAESSRLRDPGAARAPRDGEDLGAREPPGDTEDDLDG